MLADGIAASESSFCDRNASCSGGLEFKGLLMKLSVDVKQEPQLLRKTAKIFLPGSLSSPRTAQSSHRLHADQRAYMS